MISVIYTDEVLESIENCNEDVATPVGAVGVATPVCAVCVADSMIDEKELS